VIPATEREKALAALGQLSAWRADDRETWLTVGMALHSVAPDLLPAWDSWSAQSKEKYTPGECARQWRSFKPNGGITIATLIGWAQKDSGALPAPKARPQHPAPTEKPPGPPDTGKTIFQTPDAAAEALARTLKAEHVGSWTYYGPDGEEVLTVLRFNAAHLPHGKTYRPIHRNGGGWTLGDPPGKLPLYRLPNLNGARRIYVVEGEKCADAAARLGLTATTSAHGAESPHRTDWRPLAGLDVPILPDCGKPGEDYAAAVATILTALTPPARVRIVRLPALPEGGDVVDFTEARDGQDAETLRAEIEALTEKAAPWKPPAEAPPTEAKDGTDGLILEGAARCTDTANAARFVTQAGEGFRWVGAWGKWLRWTGGCWRPDDALAVLKRAKRVVSGIFTECRRESEDGARAALAKWALHSLCAERLRAMIDLARPELAVAPDDLDRDPMLLNLENGTLCLPTGELRPHAPGDLITKQAPVKFDATADCPLWHRFLARIMDGDGRDRMIGFLQRLSGMCLTGDVRDQHLFIYFGPGANGKSVYLDTITGLMGDYATQAPPDLLIIRRTPEHPTEIADLCGRRLVVSAECEEGGRLRVQLVKRLTGDRRLKGRFMRQDFFEFTRTHKTILVTNNRPQVREASIAVWRRLVLTPFSVVIPPAEQDPRLIDRLRAEWPGILNWMVSGCRQWLADGLQIPPEVLAATQAYEAEQDVLAGFLDECCVLDPRAVVARGDIYAAYEAWAKRSGESYPLSNRQLYDRLRRLPGVTDDDPRRLKGKVTRVFAGIGLVSLAPEATP